MITPLDPQAPEKNLPISFIDKSGSQRAGKVILNRLHGINWESFLTFWCYTGMSLIHNYDWG